MLTRASLLTLTIAVAVQALVTVLATISARADSTTVFSCVGVGGFFSGSGASNCVKIRREGPSQSGILHARVPSAEDMAEAEARDRKWLARCRPVLRQDDYGVSRYHYAARGCEFGKTED